LSSLVTTAIIRAFSVIQ